MALSRETAAAGVYLIGKDFTLVQALQKLLELDPEVQVVGRASSIGAAALARTQPDVVLLNDVAPDSDGKVVASYVHHAAPGAAVCLLDALADLTVRELLETVKSMAGTPANGDRHLHAVHPAEKPHPTGGTLSARELEVVRLVAEGLSNKEISVRLSLSDKTVKNHISHILAKMNLNARTQVAVYAIRAGLV